MISELLEKHIFRLEYSNKKSNNLHKFVLFQTDDGCLIQTIQIHSTPGYALAVSDVSNLIAVGSTINMAIRVLDLDKLESTDAPKLKVYENPVDCITTSYLCRLAFVKRYYGLTSSFKGYKYLNNFGIDIWNIATGNWVTLLPFNRLLPVFRLKSAEKL